MNSLSIIMPVFNSGDTIENAIESVIPVLKVNVKLIIIDGGSSDSTVDIIKKYERHIAYWISEPDRGYADALNKGILAADTEYYMMLAADDRLLPNSIERMFNSIKDTTDVWCGSIIENNQYGYAINRSDVDLEKLYYGCTLRHPATVFRRTAVIESCLYDISYKIAADRDLFIRMYRGGYKFQVVDVPMVEFASGGMSNIQVENTNYEDDMITRQYGNEPESVKTTKLHYVKTGIIKFVGVLGLKPVLYRILNREEKCMSKKRYIEYIKESCESNF